MDKGFLNALGLAIKTFRLERGLSQEQLDGSNTISRVSLSKWELGETPPNIQNLHALAQAFNCKLSAIVLEAEKIEEELKNGSKRN